MAESAKREKSLTAPRGTHDLLPKELETWHYVERTATKLFESSGFKEIRTPIFESTDLFERGVGESTDIVRKEMYTFEKGERLLTLRPENTAGLVRAYIQHGMDRCPKPLKLYYMGPMFRYERPQAGRQRQFHQIGVELFGLDTPQSDAVVILLAMELFNLLGISGLVLDINNVGCFSCREDFRQKMRELTGKYLNKLCADCRNRYETNPLRMLDCKNTICKDIYTSPEIVEFLEGENTCEPCQHHFEELLNILEKCHVNYRRNRMLVRGLDYYTGSVFEIIAPSLGAQNAICGGGRYNNLFRTLGGPDTPAVGWALGMERLVSLVTHPETKPLDFYIVSDSPSDALLLVKEMRERSNFKLSLDVDLSGKNIGKQIAQANKFKASQVIILGETERSKDIVTLKNMETGVEESLDKGMFLNSISYLSASKRSSVIIYQSEEL